MTKGGRLFLALPVQGRARVVAQQEVSHLVPEVENVDPPLGSSRRAMTTR